MFDTTRRVVRPRKTGRRSRQPIVHYGVTPSDVGDRGPDHPARPNHAKIYFSVLQRELGQTGYVATPRSAGRGRRSGTQSWLCFTCYTGSFAGPVFLAYLRRPVGHLDRKIHLIADGHPVHRRGSIRNWPAEHVDSIEIHVLPSYSPELNPRGTAQR
jgi:hypothetical protein